MLEEGKANAELLNFLSKRIDCTKRDLRIVAGEKARVKAIELPEEFWSGVGRNY